MFEIQFEDLRPRQPEFGRIGVIPWDTETFGFPVANFVVPEIATATSIEGSLGQSLEEWARSRQVELVAASLPIGWSRTAALLQDAGFQYNDTTLCLRYTSPKPIKLPFSKLELTEARGEDLPALTSIAERVFRHGRYHADPRFPAKLADRRYADWIRRTLDPANPQTTLVARIGDAIQGFCTVETGEEKGHMHLMAVSPDRVATVTGIMLPALTLRYLREHGARTILSKISAANTAVLNVHAFLGAQYFSPELCLHWHSPEATHLAPPIR